MASRIGETIPARMRIEDFKRALRECPMIASVQADEGSPLDDPEIIVRLAEASLSQGVTLLRLQGIQNIIAVREALPNVPILGLIKTEVSKDKVYISPGIREVQALIDVGCEVICVDGTRRSRAGGATLEDLIKMIHAAGRLAMADCDSLDSAGFATACGADIVSTTLGGYTRESVPTVGPDLEFVRAAARRFSIPVLGEGRYTQRWEIESALRAGAAGVVIGGAINDPIKQTRSLLPSLAVTENVGAIDIGGTWLRFGVFSSDWQLLHHDRIELPDSHHDRTAWIHARIKEARLDRVGIGSGGTIDPRTGIVSEAKSIIPDIVGRKLTDLDVHRAIAINDGLATAWGHACLPDFAGLRVATLTLGTGVGCGFVARGHIEMGRHGEYPRINDLRLAEGHTLEDYLGGAALTAGTSQPDWAVGAAKIAIEAVETLYFPDVIVLAGGVGLSPLMRPLLGGKIVASPFGEDAGLYGAAAIALFPPLY